MLYQLDDKLSIQKNIIYALQHVIYIAISAVAIPIVVAPLLGLNQNEVADVLQRTFFVSGVLSVLQVKFGHGFPIIEAPAGLWTGILTLMAGLAPTLGKSMPSLRTDLEGGLLIAGAVIMVIAAAGLIPYLTKLFTPAVNSVLIFLMVLQFSPSIVKGMLGVMTQDQAVNFKAMAVFFFIVFIILSINLFAKGFLQSTSILVGIVCGWVLSSILGIGGLMTFSESRFFSMPELFAWGKPTYSPGIAATCVLAALLLLSMTYTSINSMADMLGQEMTKKKWNRAFLIDGFSTVLAGTFPIIAFMPYISSTGFLAMTGVAARTPFLMAGAAMILMGLIKPVGLFFASIPISVGCGALIVFFSMILGQGMKELQKIKITNRESFVIGIPLIAGIGIMFYPAAFQNLPGAFAYILPNGLVDGIVLAIILDHILPRKQLVSLERNERLL